MSVIQTIKANIENYSYGQRKIANFILNNQDTITQLSSQALAKEIGVSQSSIIKFIQLLGIEGFTRFKLNLASDMSRAKVVKTRLAPLHNKIERTDTLQTIAEKLLAEKHQALMETTMGINFQLLEQIIQAILHSKRIQIAGIGSSGLVAKDLAYKLQKLALPVSCETDTHVQLAIAQSLRKDDFLIVISYSGARKEICMCAQAAKNNGATILAVTSLQQSLLRSIADYVLDAIADEQHWRSSSISSRTAQNSLIDLIFLGIVQAIGEEAEMNIKNSSALIKQLKH